MTMLRAVAGRAPALAMTMGFGMIAATGACARGLPVCTVVTPQYVMVERSSSTREGLGRAAEITETPSYKVLHGAFKSVALRLPDNCYPGYGGGVARGGDSHESNQDAASLESACGIPLQVLESTLTKAGYQVLSWSTLMGIEKQQNVPVHIAAQQLGADFVIIVNDMYVGTAPAGGEAEARYRYVASDPEGHRDKPAELFQADRDWMKKFVRERLGNDPQAEGAHSLQARLNATVVLAKGAGSSPPPGAAPAPGAPAAPAPPVAAQLPQGNGRSGEAIWFYNWRLGNLENSHAGMRFLFGGIPVGEYADAFPGRAAIDVSDPNRHYWWPVLPASEAIPEVQRDRATSEESFQSHSDVTPEQEAELYRRIAEDFIQRFKGG
jgi:hypothetical protein